MVPYVLRQESCAPQQKHSTKPYVPLGLSGHSLPLHTTLIGLCCLKITRSLLRTSHLATPRIMMISITRSSPHLILLLELTAFLILLGVSAPRCLQLALQDILIILSPLRRHLPFSLWFSSQRRMQGNTRTITVL